MALTVHIVFFSPRQYGMFSNKTIISHDGTIFTYFAFHLLMLEIFPPFYVLLISGLIVVYSLKQGNQYTLVIFFSAIY